MQPIPKRNDRRPATSHIQQKHAAAINQFYAETFNPYLKFHRPRYFALDTIDAKGKIKKTYPHDVMISHTDASRWSTAG
jgi:hypothetical protein